MNSFRRFFDLILFGNIYVALGAVCLIQSTAIQILPGEHIIPYSFLAFFATLFVYNFQRIFYAPKKDKSLHSIRRKWIFKNQFIIKTITFTGMAGVCVSFFYNDPRIAFYLSPLLLLSFAYFLPFIRLRKSPWFKLFTLTIVWTMATAVVPIILIDPEPFTSFNLLHIAVRFIFLIAICLPFDIRDLEIDKADDISTVPHLIGENKTRGLAFIFMLTYSLLIIMEYYFNMFRTGIFIALMASAMINTYLVLMSSSKRSEYFFVAALDGTMILQGVLLLLSEKMVS